jgi:hypothetical protein
MDRVAVDDPRDGSTLGAGPLDPRRRRVAAGEGEEDDEG